MHFLELKCYTERAVDKHPKIWYNKNTKTGKGKQEALKLSDEIGLKKAAQQLGIQYYTLSDWRTKRNAAAKAKKYQMTDDEAKLRITELERENAELRKANDILKDALGFFAKDRKK